MWISASGGPGGASYGPTHDYWYTPVGTLSGFGHISAERARCLAIVYACAKVLSETVAQLPLILYRRLPNGGKERASDHPLSRIVGQRPNVMQTSFEWREMMEDHLVLRGNAYSRIVSEGPRISGLVPLHPDLVEPRELDNGSWTYLYKSRRFGVQRIDRDDMLHLRGHATSGIVGLSPIEVQRQAVGFAIAAQDHGARFYQNGATFPGWIEHPSHFATKEDKTKFIEAFREATTGRKKFLTPVFEYGLKYHDLPLKHVDMQYLETLKDRAIDIARIFRVQPHKVGILEGAIKSNIEQQSIEFVTDTLMPNLRRWEQRLNETLLTEEEQQHFFFEFLVDGLLRGDSKSRALFYNKAIQDGWLTRNEVRELENRNPLPGLDEPLQPLNMVGAAELEADEPDDEEQGAAPEGDRASALNMAAAERIVRKEVAALRKIIAHAGHADTLGEDVARFYSTHIKYVRSVMLVDESRASGWCNDQMHRLLSADFPQWPKIVDSWLPARARDLAKIIDESGDSV